MLIEGIDCEEPNDSLSHRNYVARFGGGSKLLKVRRDSQMSISVDGAGEAEGFFVLGFVGGCSRDQ
jgi:hypothetical protein